MFRHLPIARIGHSVCCQQVRTAYNDGQRAKILSKLLRGKSSGLHKLPAQSVLSIQPGNVVTSRKGVPTKTLSRRKTMLNKMFMIHICELISSDAIVDDLKKYDLEITSTEIKGKFNALHVFWKIGSANADDLVFVDQKLKSIAYKLRGDLTRMQVMGVVPLIKFVRDTSGMVIEQMDELFDKADYGDDYEAGKLKPSIKDKFETNLLDQGEDPVFSMRQDVFGLNHAVIMGRVKQHMNNARNANKNTDSNELGPAKEFSLNTSLNEIRKTALYQTRSKSVLTEFLRERRKEMKALKGMNQNKIIEPDLLEDIYLNDDDNNNLCTEENDEAYLNKLFYDASSISNVLDDVSEEAKNRDENVVSDTSIVCDDHNKSECK